MTTIHSCEYKIFDDKITFNREPNIALFVVKITKQFEGFGHQFESNTFLIFDIKHSSFNNCFFEKSYNCKSKETFNQIVVEVAKKETNVNLCNEKSAAVWELLRHFSLFTSQQISNYLTNIELQINEQNTETTGTLLQNAKEMLKIHKNFCLWRENSQETRNQSSNDILNTLVEYYNRSKLITNIQKFTHSDVNFLKAAVYTSIGLIGAKTFYDLASIIQQKMDTITREPNKPKHHKKHPRRTSVRINRKYNSSRFPSITKYDTPNTPRTPRTLRKPKTQRTPSTSRTQRTPSTSRTSRTPSTSRTPRTLRKPKTYQTSKR